MLYLSLIPYLKILKQGQFVNFHEISNISEYAIVYDYTIYILYFTSKTEYTVPTWLLDKLCLNKQFLNLSWSSLTFLFERR